MPRPKKEATEKPVVPKEKEIKSEENTIVDKKEIVENSESKNNEKPLEKSKKESINIKKELPKEKLEDILPKAKEELDESKPPKECKGCGFHFGSGSCRSCVNFRK